MELTAEQIRWVEDNMLFFTSSIRPNREQIEDLFSIYSMLDGKQHKPTGCGRCIATARNRVWSQFQKQTDRI